MTKPHAGNTGRHDYDGKGFCPCGAEVGCESSDRICSAPNSILWDRLRADLANLGAAYGELPAHIRDYQEGPCETVSDHSGDVTNMITQPDLNLYYDGIILAARKKREALAWMDEPLTDDERDICHQMWDEQERAERVASALSKPLDHEPRLGWKPGDCE